MEKCGEQLKLHISVRNLVEFIFREGDIDNRAGRLAQAEAMMEGSRIHRKIQQSMGAGYKAEVPLALCVEAEDYVLEIEGRADGIWYMTAETLEAIRKEEGAYRQLSLELDETKKPQNAPEELCGDLYYIDEIKGVYRDVGRMKEPLYVHKAQAMCYAYIYALQNRQERMGVQMTYCNLDSEMQRHFREEFTFDELAAWFGELIAAYRRWTDFQVRWRRRRQASIAELAFPYPYREGQKELMADVYRTIRREKTLFLQAPTGVGKTLATIFPAVKAMGEGLAENIFYLTAKTVTASVAKEAFALLKEQGYVAKTIRLTAKEKLCVCDEMDCNPLHCPYARGHYDRVNDAVYELLQRSDLFTREEILAQAHAYNVCPFEMSLDVSSWVDHIVCDYNYAFDPNVYLKRFFQEGVRGSYIFLVDEAHNLVDRSREMYSAALVKEDVLAVKRVMKRHHKGIERTLDKCNRELLNYKRECGEGEDAGLAVRYRVYDNIGVLMFHLMRARSQLEEFLETPRDFPEKKTVMDFYFDLRNFMEIYDLVDEHYVIYSQLREDKSFAIRLFCVDPSANLQKCIDRARSTIFFSATLLPVNYYKRLLSTRTDNYAVYARSAFSEEQRLLLFGTGVSTKYTRRGRREYEKIARYILAAVSGRQGNYMAFFPSYKLMQEVAEAFESERPDGLEVMMQRTGMKEQEREEFLAVFERERTHTLVAFCVLGGIFSEGIDLKNDRLIGAVIVGCGLPQVSCEREILKNYYDRLGMSGFDYAFRYPGMNKVLQAAGRVIRTGEDRGVILLLDERFLQSDYEPLFPREWSRWQIAPLEETGQLIARFWQEN